jgi:hypothetical protein
MKTKTNLTDRIKNVIDNVVHNAHIYAGAGLITLSSCGRPSYIKETIEYDGLIGTTHVLAKKITNVRKDDLSLYVMKEVLEDKTKILYSDYGTDKNIDHLTIVHPGGDKEIISKDRALFNAANEHYKQLRDTIPSLSVAAKKRDYELKTKADSTEIKKYFGN